LNDIGVAFYFKGAKSVTSTSNVFENCQVTDKGSIFALYNTNIVETGSTYQYNAALNGGAIYCEGCIISMVNAIFKYQQAKNGAVIYGNEAVDITMDNVQVLDSSAKYGVLAYFTETTAPTGV
jgi:hypothetical protein